MEHCKAVILAGGEGTRLYPVTKEIPKPLLPVAKKPIINYLIELFLGQGINDIAVLISQQSKEDFDWWEKRYYPEKNLLLVEEKEPLGTFGGLYLIKDWLGDSNFFMTNGDELKEIDLAKMKEFHFQKPGIATIALVEVPNPQDYGVAICEDGMIKKFVEKPSPSQISRSETWEGKNPPSNYISSGLYFFSPKVFDYHPGLADSVQGAPPKFCMVETDLFPKLAKENKLAGFKFQGKWADCGNLQRWEDAIRNWTQK